MFLPSLKEDETVLYAIEVHLLQERPVVLNFAHHASSPISEVFASQHL